MALEELTREEETVMLLMKEVGRPIGEHEFHMIMKITQDLTKKTFYKFEFKYWEHVNENYKTGMGTVPYSQKLHEQIDELVRKGYMKRDSDNPIVISEKKQLNLF